MKKVVSILLVLVLSFTVFLSLTACGCRHANVKDEVCADCHEVIDAEQALACYIKKEGTKTDSSTYVVYNTTYKDGTRVRAGVYYDCDDQKIRFGWYTTVSGWSTMIGMDLDIGNNTQKVKMLCTTETGKEYYSDGEIHADTYSEEDDSIYKYNGYDCPTSLKGMMEAGVSLMLSLCETIIEESDTGVTMPMLGFKKF